MIFFKIGISYLLKIMYANKQLNVCNVALLVSIIVFNLVKSNHGH